MKKERISSLFPSRAAGVATRFCAVALILLALLIAANALLGALPSRYTLFNLASSNAFSLSGKSRDWLKTLETPVKLYLIQNGGEASADNALHLFLQEYEEASGAVDVEVVDPRAQKDFITAYGDAWPSDGSVIVSSEKRYRVIENEALYYYYNSLINANMTAAEYDQMTESIAAMDESGDYLRQFAEATTAYFEGESLVTNAINFVIQEKIAVAYTLTGNGAIELSGEFRGLLSQTGYEMRTLLSLASVPEDCDLLILHTPATDLSEAEAAALSTYLSEGGKLFLTTYYKSAELKNLAGVLNLYGLGYAGRNYVCDGNPGYYFTDSNGSYPELFRAHIAQHGATGEFVDTFVAYEAHALSLSEVEGVTVTPWLKTSEAGYLKVYNESTNTFEKSDETGEYTFGAIAEKGDACIVWLACPAALESPYNSISENSGNFTLARSAMDFMSGANVSGIAIDPSSTSVDSLSVTGAQFAAVAVVLVLLLPLGVAITGVVVWVRRKRR